MKFAEKILRNSSKMSRISLRINVTTWSLLMRPSFYCGLQSTVLTSFATFLWFNFSVADYNCFIFSKINIKFLVVSNVSLSVSYSVCNLHQTFDQNCCFWSIFNLDVDCLQLGTSFESYFSGSYIIWLHSSIQKLIRII